MVSIYSLRPVYTFLYTIINGNVIGSFVQKKKVLRFCGPKTLFLRTYAKLKSPLPLCIQSYAFGLTPPLPLYTYVLCGWPLTTVIGTPDGIASISSLVFLISNGITKIILKTMRRETNKNRKIALLDRSKLNNLDKIISKIMIDPDISHGEFT